VDFHNNLDHNPLFLCNRVGAASYDGWQRTKLCSNKELFIESDTLDAIVGVMSA
jgi:hypothetical protein